jgi:hypothetical protein
MDPLHHHLVFPSLFEFLNRGLCLVLTLRLGLALPGPDPKFTTKLSPIGIRSCEFSRTIISTDRQECQCLQQTLVAPERILAWSS